MISCAQEAEHDYCACEMAIYIFTIGGSEMIKRN